MYFYVIYKAFSEKSKNMFFLKQSSYDFLFKDLWI